MGWGGAWPGAGAQAAWSLPLLPCAQTGPWGGRVGAAPLLEEGLSSDARLGLLGLVLRLGRWAGGRSAVREWAVDQSPAAHCPLPVRSISRHQVTGAPRDARLAPYKPWGSKWQAGRQQATRPVCLLKWTRWPPASSLPSPSALYPSDWGPAQHPRPPAA